MKKIILAFIALFILAQFFQPAKNKAADGEAHIATIQGNLQIPDRAHAIMKVACYDCHSDNTHYPWYDNITPVNFWVNNHIEEGKEHLNFSIFHKYTVRKKDHKYEEIVEMIEKKSMPLKSYLITHFDAKLSDEQRQAIIQWAKEQRGKLDYDKSMFSEE